MPFEAQAVGDHYGLYAVNIGPEMSEQSPFGSGDGFFDPEHLEDEFATCFILGRLYKHPCNLVHFCTIHPKHLRGVPLSPPLVGASPPWLALSRLTRNLLSPSRGPTFCYRRSVR